MNGVFRPLPLETACKENNQRVEAYERAVARYIAGEIDLASVYRGWAAPIYGAFGEELR